MAKLSREELHKKLNEVIADLIDSEIPQEVYDGVIKGAEDFFRKNNFPFTNSYVMVFTEGLKKGLLTESDDTHTGMITAGCLTKMVEERKANMKPPVYGKEKDSDSKEEESI